MGCRPQVGALPAILHSDFQKQHFSKLRTCVLATRGLTIVYIFTGELTTGVHRTSGTTSILHQPVLTTQCDAGRRHV